MCNNDRICHVCNRLRYNQHLVYRRWTQRTVIGFDIIKASLGDPIHRDTPPWQFLRSWKDQASLTLYHWQLDHLCSSICVDTLVAGAESQLLFGLVRLISFSVV